MFSILSEVPSLTPGRTDTLAAEMPRLEKDLEHVWTLRNLLSFDSRGYLNLSCALTGQAAPIEELSDLALSLREMSREVLAFAASRATTQIFEKVDFCFEMIRSELPNFSMDRFRMAVIELALKHNPESLDPQRLAQTILNIAENLTPVTAAKVTAFLFLPCLGNPSILNTAELATDANR